MTGLPETTSVVGKILEHVLQRIAADMHRAGKRVIDCYNHKRAKEHDDRQHTFVMVSS